MIYVIPECGLCNRIRVIDSAISLADDWGVKLVVFWKLNDDLNASFYDLFEPIYTKCGQVKIIEIDNASYDLDILKLHFRGFNYFSRPVYINMDDISNNTISVIYNSLYSSFLTGKDNYSNHVGDINNFWSIYFRKNILIKTYSRFYQSIYSDYRKFIPRKDIIADSNVLISCFTNSTLGVHIRRTDNQESIEKSTNQLFVNEIKLRLRLNPNLKIYLSSDSNEEKQYFINTFPDKVISNNCEFDRSSKLSIKHALIDLICLSKCNAILGSYYSSFSEFAITYKGLKEYKIVF
jgi:hypothetical protein